MIRLGGGGYAERLNDGLYAGQRSLNRVLVARVAIYFLKLAIIEADRGCGNLTTWPHTLCANGRHNRPPLIAQFPRDHPAECIQTFNGRAADMI
jgi:hypothetical protein